MATTNIKKLVYPYNDGADQAIADFTNIPTLNGNNAFTGSNTFTTLVKADSGDSWETINNNDFITKAEANLELEQIKRDITAIEQGGISAATTEKAGIVELATGDEITQGTANKVVTADGLKTVTDTINTAITNITNGTTAIDLPEATTEVKGIIEIATDTEATTGTATNLAVTPKQLKAAIGSVTIAAATTEASGIVELATPQEVTSGTANKVVTADNLKTVTDAINTSITNITNGTTSITLPDASTTQKGVVELADSTEISAGTATDKVVTVKDVMDMITAQIKAQDVHHVVDSIEDIPEESPDGVYIVTGA